MFLYFRKIFWTDRGYPPKIESANLDGSDHKIIINTFLFWPNGIAIDYHNDRLYWADTKSHTVETSDFSGNDRHIVRTFEGKHKTDIEFFFYCKSRLSRNFSHH